MTAPIEGSDGTSSGVDADASPASDVSRLSFRLELASVVFVGLNLLTTAVLYFSSGIFYQRFGLSPSEAGIGVADLLITSALGILYWLSLPVIAVVPAVIYGTVLIHQLRAEGLEGWKTLGLLAKAALAIVLTTVLLFAALVYLYQLGTLVELWANTSAGWR